MDRHRRALSGDAWRALAYGAPLAFLGLFFVYPLSAILERGLSGEGSSARDVLTDPRTREVVWFTVWQAVASTLLTIAGRAPCPYVLGRDRFRGRSVVSAVVLVPFVLPTVVVALAFLAILPDPSSRDGADPRRARLLQRRCRRARRRDVLGESRPAPVRGGGDARREPVAALSRDHSAAALAGAGGGGGHRLPLLVHVVRHRPHPRRPAVRHARGRDLRPGGADVRPARGRRPVARPARLRPRRRPGGRATRTARGVSRHVAARARRAAPPPHHGREARRRRKPRRARALPRPPAGGARRTLARRRRRPRLRRLPGARSRDEHPARGPLDRGRELRRVRDRGNRDRRRRRGAGRVRSRWRRAALACSTRSCCFRSVRRR